MIWFLLAFLGGEPTQIFFVRHAEKATDQGSNPHLTEQGEFRVEKLVAFLESVQFDGVFSTPYVRTQETAQPIAKHHGVEVTTVEVQDFNKMLGHLGSKPGTYFIAGHSNTIPEWIQTLGCQSQPIDESDYSSLFLVNKNGDSCQVFRFNFDACME